jgi:hypothetical protein
MHTSAVRVKQNYFDQIPAESQAGKSPNGWRFHSQSSNDAHQSDGQ